MVLKTVKRLAADLLGVGISRIRINPSETKRADEAMTRNDVRDLIRDKVVYLDKVHGQRTNEKRKRHGHGKRKGTANARTPGKTEWIRQVRSQRKYLKDLVKNGILKKESKREVYLKIKGNAYKGKRAMFLSLQENGFVASSAKYEDTVVKVERPAKQAAAPKPKEGKPAEKAPKSEKKGDAAEKKHAPKNDKKV